MSKTLVCPHCGKSGKITTTDNEPLANYQDSELAKNEDYFLENEVYATAHCWDCNHEFKIVGDIIWQNSINVETPDEVIHIIKKDFFVNYNLNGGMPNEMFTTTISVEYPIDNSADNKLKIILNEINSIHRANYYSGNFTRNCNIDDIVIKVLTEI